MGVGRYSVGCGAAVSGVPLALWGPGVAISSSSIRRLSSSSSVEVTLYGAALLEVILDMFGLLQG